MKKTIVSMAIVSTLFAGTVGVSSVFAASLDDNQDKVVANQNVSIQSNMLADLSDSSSKSPNLVEGLLAAKNLTNNTTAMTKVNKVEKTPTVASYTVEAGDTIENIAKAFEVPKDDLLKWNEGLEDGSLIKVGQSLKVQTEKDPSKVEVTKLTWENPVVEETTAATPEAPVNQAPEVQAASQEEVTTPVSAPVATTEATSSAPTTGRTITVSSTAYSYAQPGLSTFTATGIDLTQTPNVIAVDPSVIPLGSRVMVEGYGEAIAGDTGGAIVGNRIDVHFSSVAECYQWGSRSVQVTILD